jgi:hypothetical protein
MHTSCVAQLTLPSLNRVGLDAFGYKRISVKACIRESSAHLLTVLFTSNDPFRVPCWTLHSHVGCSLAGRRRRGLYNLVRQLVKYPALFPEVTVTRLALFM